MLGSRGCHMRLVAVVLWFALQLVANGPANAADRPACIAACETKARTCLTTANEKYDGCTPAARKDCSSKPSSELFECMRTSQTACSRTRSAEAEPCRAEFQTCYAACGPRPPQKADYWCELDANSPASTARIRKYAFCAGSHDQCINLYKPTDPTLGFSLDCSPLP